MPRFHLPFVFAVVVAFAPSSQCAELDETAKLRQLLEGRRQQQLEEAGRIKAFHHFTFRDEVEKSGIRFENHIVEDAGKNWTPAHYDHGTGVAAADVDGDGRSDVFFVDQFGQSQLWRNLGGGKFEDFTAQAGLIKTGLVQVAAAFADIDNDGDPDLFITTVRGGNMLFENAGQGRFKDVSKQAGVDYVGHSSGAVFFDFNNDGLLDLFVANVGIYSSDRKRNGFHPALPDAFSGHLHLERTERSVLYQNLGGGKFRDVTQATRLLDDGWSGDASFADLNSDGFPDLYVLNMQGMNHYWENQGGKSFADKTAAHFPKTPWGAMGIKFFDYDQDGRTDLFVMDMHSDMTPGQTRQARNMGRRVEDAKSDAWCTTEWLKDMLQGKTNTAIFGNALWHNEGNRRFAEVSDAMGAETFWPWGPTVADLNADGFEDVFVASGMGHPFRYAINPVLLNEGGRRFARAEFALGIEPRRERRMEKDYFTLDCSGADATNSYCEGRKGLTPVRGSLSTRSAVAFDVEDDGDLDLITNEMFDRPQVLVSDLSQKQSLHFLKVKLVGTRSNRDGLGAWVTVKTGARTLSQPHDGKSGYLAQSSLPLYFGLGSETRIASVEVRWPSGLTQAVTNNLVLNKLLTITEPAK